MKPNEPASLLPGLPEGSRILAVRLRSLGDIVLLTPALEALHEWRSDLRISVLIEPGFAPVLEGNPAIAELLTLEGFASTAAALRRRRFAIAYNQHAGPRSALLTAASGAPVRVSWAGRQFSQVYNILVPGLSAFYGQAKAHTVEYGITQFYWTGLPRGPIPAARVYPQADALAAVERRLASHGVAPGEPYAVLRPGAASFTKRWALEQFAELARWLREEAKLKAVTDFGPGDRQIEREVRRLLEPVSVVFTSLDLRELIALISRARLFVGNDTGPTHLAAALARPTVAIFGSSSSVIWGPWRTPHRVAQQDFPCNPCRGDRCYAFSEPRCILSVSQEQVRSACRSLLEETQVRPA